MYFLCTSRDSSCEAGESELNESQEERSVSSSALSTHKTTSSSTVGKRKRLRKKKGVGLRKKLRTHIESVEEFNPEARDAQTAELDRIRRLELQRRLSSTHDDMEVASNEPAEAIAESASAVVGETRQSSSSPEVIKVEAREVIQVAVASNKAAVEPIIIDSGSSDSDTNYQRPPVPRALSAGSSRVGGPSHAPRRTGQAPREPLRGKYDVFTARSDGHVLVNEGHSPSEEDLFLAPQVARVAKPHQVCGCTLALCRAGHGDISRVGLQGRCETAIPCKVWV